MRSTFVSLVFFATMCPVLTQAQSAGSEKDRLIALENAWNQAELRHDVPALSLLIGDPFVFTDADGSFLNRTEWLAHVKNAVDDFQQLGNSSMAAHIYGTAAVVTGEYRERLKIGGKSVERRGRFTDTWILEKGQWKCVASQSTLISH